MTATFTRIALAAGLLFGSTAVAAAPIVTNGSFENGMTGWTRTGSGTTSGVGINSIATGFPNDTGYGDNVPNYDGTHAAYFVDDNAFETLSQFVSLVGGTKYNLSYALFATPSGAANPFSFSLLDSVGFDILDYASNTSGHTDVPVGVWTPYSFSFTAPVTSNAYLLDFAFASGATPAKDVLLDGVQINAAVPESSTWALMLLGFGAIGFTMRRRKTHASEQRTRVAYS